MSYEIDYIPVGQGERAGDALAIRYGNLSIGAPRDEQVVIVIDGGTKESGEKLVKRIQEDYGTNKVDYVFSTHLDSDHLSGLTVILEKLEVRTLYMHIPWEHLDETNPLFVGDFTNSELEQELKNSLDLVHEVETLAIEKGVSIEEPFAGTVVNANVIVLGPTKEYYELLLTQFRETPKAKTIIEEILETLRKTEERAVNWIEDNILVDLLDDNATTSAENNSSVILLLNFDGHKLLFTGDAGIPALTAAAGLSESLAMPLSDLQFLHVPHHGSKHNLGSSILQRIKAKIAIVSGAKESTKHPSKRITNALKKHSTSVTVVRETPLMQSHNSPPRIGWGPVREEPFYDRFDEE